MLPFTTLEKDIRKNLKHNIKVNLWDGSLFGVALGFASFSTVLPLFVASMTTSALLIGLVPAIHSVGWQLPQLFTASHVSRLRKYKRNVLMMTINERAPFLGFAITALLLPLIGLQAGLVITFMLLIWQGLGGGFTANSWTSMISKIIPSRNTRNIFWNASRPRKSLHQRISHRSGLYFGCPRFPLRLCSLLPACRHFLRCIMVRTLADARA